MLAKRKKIILGMGFLSGFAALLYEIIWLRETHLIFGVSFYALATVFSAFLGGLVLGSYFSGKYIDRFVSLEKIAKAYGFIEIGIGVGALLVPILLYGVEPLLGYFYNLGLGLWGFNLVRFFLAGIILLVPTFFIGATFPIIFRLYTESRKEIKEGVSLLYFMNTLGGVLGVALTGFFFIKFFGMNLTLGLGVLINFVLGFFAFSFSKVYKERKLENYFEEKRGRRNRKIGLFLFLFFVSGFTALAYEVVWTRFLVLYFHGTTYSFSALLIVFLLGISLGSFVYSKFFKSGDFKKFGFLQLLVAFTAILGFWIYTSLSFDFILGFEANVFVLFFVSGVLALFPAVFLGIAFPLVSDYFLNRKKEIGFGMGKLYSINTLGAILGSFFAGFYLIPFLGLKSSLFFIAFLNLGVGFIAFGLGKVKGRNYLYFIFVLFFVLFISFNVNEGFYGLDLNDDVKVLYNEEGLSGRVNVLGVGEYSQLLVDNQVVAADTPVLALDSKILAHLPLLLHENPKTALTVGFGSGGTSYSMLLHDLDFVDAVEIEEKVVEASEYFDSLNHGVVSDERLNIILDDARSYLTHTDKKYDVISTDVTNLRYHSNSNLYTKEYFEILKNRLNEGGIVVAWIPVLDIGKEGQKTLMRTFSSVFENMSVWQMYSKLSGYFVYVGYEEELKIDYGEFKEKFDELEVENDLKEVGINEYNLLNSLFLDSEAVDLYAGEGEIHTDNHPVLEFPDFNVDGISSYPDNMISVFDRKIDPVEYIRFESKEQGEEFLEDFRYEQIRVAGPLIEGHRALLEGDDKRAAFYYKTAIENADYLETVDII